MARNLESIKFTNKKLNAIVDVLGKPFFSSDNFLLYNMDCEVGMKKLVDIEKGRSII